MTTNEIIAEFAAAHDAAKDNPALLIKDSGKYTSICVERMKRVELADQALFTISNWPDLPVEAKKFFQAHEDRGCSSCRYAACGAIHPECDTKIKRWFQARDALVEYGLKL
jgi:hypothetical protein